MPQHEEHIPFDYTLPGSFDVGPAGPKGPSIGNPYFRGEKKYSPWVQDFNWKARITSEEKATERFKNCFDMATMTFRPKITRPSTPAAATTLLPRFLQDETVRRSLSVACRRARAIDHGENVKAVSTAVGSVPNKREIILGAAQPLLDTEADLSALDDFLSSRVKDWNSPNRVKPTHGFSLARPRSQASTRPSSSRPVTQATALARPSTVPHFAQRSARPATVGGMASRPASSRQGSIRQPKRGVTQFRHIEL